MEIFTNEDGKIKGSFSITPLIITDGKIAPCGSSYHLTIRKDIAKEIGPGRRIGIIIFEQGIRDD
jgi:hypothetical protein